MLHRAKSTASTCYSGGRRSKAPRAAAATAVKYNKRREETSVKKHRSEESQASAAERQLPRHLGEENRWGKSPRPLTHFYVYTDNTGCGTHRDYGRTREVFRRIQCFRLHQIILCDLRVGAAVCVHAGVFTTRAQTSDWGIVWWPASSREETKGRRAALLMPMRRKDCVCCCAGLQGVFSSASSCWLIEFKFSNVLFDRRAKELECGESLIETYLSELVRWNFRSTFEMFNICWGEKKVWKLFQFI